MISDFIFKDKESDPMNCVGLFVDTTWSCFRELSIWLARSCLCIRQRRRKWWCWWNGWRRPRDTLAWYAWSSRSSFYENRVVVSPISLHKKGHSMVDVIIDEKVKWNLVFRYLFEIILRKCFMVHIDKWVIEWINKDGSIWHSASYLVHQQRVSELISEQMSRWASKWMSVIVEWVDGLVSERLSMIVEWVCC